VIWVFGWAGGKALVEESYREAKAKAAERKADREGGPGHPGVGRCRVRV
jgi:hypothetical protein